MSLSEFSIISQYFQRAGLAAEVSERSQIQLGIGDDCALLSPSDNKCLSVSLDVLNSGIHFPEDAPAELIANRALAVNLSDLAAMGAKPVGFSLGLSLPVVNESWLDSFSAGLMGLSQEFQCPLIGGDLTKGPLSIAIQIYGEVAKNEAITRSGAQAGDLVYISGQLGGAAAAVEYLNTCDNDTSIQQLINTFYKPVPRIILGQALSPYATACIDISDGLLADLKHIADQSAVVMEIEASLVPVNPLLDNVNLPQSSLNLALTGGDDYELAFTIPAKYKALINDIAESSGCQITNIGKVVEGSAKEGTVHCLNSSGNIIEVDKLGYQHF